MVQGSSDYAHHIDHIHRITYIRSLELICLKNKNHAKLGSRSTYILTDSKIKTECRHDSMKGSIALQILLRKKNHRVLLTRNT